MAGLFDWQSLITPAVNLGMRAVGDAVAPSPDLQMARESAQNSQQNRELQLAKMANAQKIRQQTMPGLYTQLGNSPQQAQRMANEYTASTPNPASYSGGGRSSGGGVGSTIGKAALGVGMGMAPGLIAKGIGALGSGGGAYTRQAIQTGLGAAGTAGGAAGGSGILGTLGGLATNPITIAAAGALGIGLLAKHYFGNGPDRMAANELTGNGGVHEFFRDATAKVNATPNGPDRQAAENARDRAVEQQLLKFSQIDKDHYYQAQQTLRQFSKFSTVKPLLG